MIPIFWVVLLLSPFAHAYGNFSNSTLQSELVKLNISSSLTATGIEGYIIEGYIIEGYIIEGYIIEGYRKCLSLHSAWSSSIVAFYKSLSLAAANGDYTFSSTIYTGFNYSSLPYTLVDGYPRQSLIPTATYFLTFPLPPRFTKPYPNCSKFLHGNCGKCTLRARVVEVYYWPIKTVSSHPNMTITSNDAELVTTVLDGITLTSPMVYLSFNTLYTFNRCGEGDTYTKVGFSMSANALSSIEFSWNASLGRLIENTRSLNFEDLYGPVPARAWLGQLLCAPIWKNTTRCLQIQQQNYIPQLALPSEIRSLHPGWENCDMESSTDPPRLLQPAQALAGPTSELNADPPAPTIPPQASFRPLGPVRTADPHIVFSPAAAPDAPPKNGDPSVKDPPDADPSVKNPAAPGSPGNNPAAQNSPANNSPETDGLTQDPSDSGSSSSGREAAIITLGSQTYTVNANSHFIIDSKTLSVGGPAAIVSGQTVSLNAKGVIVGGIMHTFSAISSPIQSNLDTTEAMLYTGPGGKKVIVIGSSTLSTGGEGGNVGGQTLSVGANGLVIGSKTIDFSAFGPSKPTSGGLMIGGKSFSLAGIHRLTSPEELQMLPTSAFSPASPTTDPNLPHVLPTVVIVSAEKITVDPAGQYLVNGKTFTLKHPVTPGAADLATTIISDPLVTSTAQPPPTIVGAPLERSGLSSSIPVGLGQRIFDAFVGGGGGGSSGGGGQGKEDGGSQGARSGPAAGNNNTGGETGAGVMAYTGRAAGRFSYHYRGWLLMVGVAAAWGWR